VALAGLPRRLLRPDGPADTGWIPPTGLVIMWNQAAAEQSGVFRLLRHSYPGRCDPDATRLTVNSTQRQVFWSSRLSGLREALRGAGYPRPDERHEERRRVLHEVEQVLEPATRIGRSRTVRFGLHLCYPDCGRAATRALPLGVAYCSIEVSVLRDTAATLPQVPGLPSSEDYGRPTPP